MRELKRGLYIILFLLAAALDSLAQAGASNIEFVENRGQWDARVKFRGEIGIGALFLEKKGFSVLLYHPDDLAAITDSHHGMNRKLGGPVGGSAGSVAGTSAAGGKGSADGAADAAGGTGVAASGVGGTGVAAGDALAGRLESGAGGKGPFLRSHVYRVSFAGASDDVTIVPEKALPGYDNYLIGNDSTKWARNCSIYQSITYKNIYPNIDVRYYTYNGQLKYDVIVHPGGDLSRVQMVYEGASRLSIKKGQLLTATSVTTVTQPSPYSYTFDPQKGRSDIDCRYVIRNGNTVSFKAADYDGGTTLVVDPTIVFCTFTGSKVSNWGFTATPGPAGTFFAGGIVFGSAYPYTTGALQPGYGGGSFDVGIIKFSSNGSSKLYATYLGGRDAESPHSMIADAQGDLIVLGRTYSDDFPHVTKVGPGGGADMFVVKLSADGSSVLGGLKIGGTGNDCVNMEDQVRSQNERADSLIRNYGDDSRSEVILDPSGNILVAASSQSPESFPIIGNVFQPVFGGGHQDAVVLKINPGCTSVLWSSFFGGEASDAAFVLKVSPANGDIFFAGATSSSKLPGNKSGVIQPAYGGGSCDGYVAEISADGSVLRRVTYLGTAVQDAIYGIQFDKYGFPYVMGTTNGTWPVINAAFNCKAAKQFVSKLQPDLSAYVFSTTFGDSLARSIAKPNISPVAFLVDRCENLYVSGWGGWIIGAEGDPYGLSGTLGMPISADASKKFTDNRDFYFIVIQRNSASLLYGTFFGQDDNSSSISEHVDGGTSRYDDQGVIYQAICANCNGGANSRFPTTLGVWAPVNGAGKDGCNEAALKIAFHFAGVSAGIRVSVNGRANDSSGCVPMDTDLQDTIRNAKSYIWDFGDGSPQLATTDYDVQHTYNTPGKYTIMLVAIDSSSCNVADTAYHQVIARTDRAPVDFNFIKDPAAACTSLDYDFTNASQAPAGKPFGPKSFIWDFGDNTGRLTTGFDPLSHTYANPGTYNVTLVLNDTAYCNYPDSLVKSLRVSPLAKAQFITPASGCAPYSAYFNNTSLGGVSFTWDFGDGTGTSADVNPTHVYTNPGTYTVTLQEVDPNTCNKTDQTQQTITVHAGPKSAFTYAPDPPTANTPDIFTNASTGGVSFIWSFGDGDTVRTASMDTVMHQYVQTDSFYVCLLTTNEFGCTDTSCQVVQTLINPLLDVPNAFTPGRFGQNAIIRVVGFGIMHMDFRIYNRWGKQVFASDNPDLGWDGTYNGVLQPMDVYTYTLEANFSDGRRVTKKGDITLIR